MPNPEADRWNEKYSQELELWLEMEPRQLLVSFIHMLPKYGLALDAACGVGTNAIFLARHGLNVIGMDISEYALRQAISRVRFLGLPIDVAVADLSRLWLPPETFDVITNFHFLERTTIEVYKQAMKSGGYILFDTFMAKFPSNDSPVFSLEPGELRSFFDNFEIIHYAEEMLEHGRNYRERSVARIVARKP